MTCRSGCPTKDHANWGECARDSVQFGSATGAWAAHTKAFDADMDAYPRLRKEGVVLPEVRGAAFKEQSGMSPEAMAVRL